jgi:hypothetical protein
MAEANFMHTWFRLVIARHLGGYGDRLVPHARNCRPRQRSEVHRSDCWNRSRVDIGPDRAREHLGSYVAVAADRRCCDRGHRLAIAAEGVNPATSKLKERMRPPTLEGAVEECSRELLIRRDPNKPIRQWRLQYGSFLVVRIWICNISESRSKKSDRQQ